MRHKLIDNDRACYLVEVAERVYGVDPMNSRGARDEVYARCAVAVQLLNAGEKLVTIGAFFKKSHCTIYYAKKNHPQWYKYDKYYQKRYDEFVEEIAKPTNKIDYTINDIKGRIQKFNAQLLELNYTPEMILEFWEEVILEGRKKQSA